MKVLTQLKKAQKLYKWSGDEANMISLLVQMAYTEGQVQSIKDARSDLNACICGGSNYDTTAHR